MVLSQKGAVQDHQLEVNLCCTQTLWTARLQQQLQAKQARIANQDWQFAYPLQPLHARSRAGATRLHSHTSHGFPCKVGLILQLGQETHLSSPGGVVADVVCVQKSQSLRLLDMQTCCQKCCNVQCEATRNRTSSQQAKGHDREHQLCAGGLYAAMK